MNDQLEINAVTEAIIGAAIEAQNQLDSQILRVLRNSAFIKFDESQQYSKPYQSFESGYWITNKYEGGQQPCKSNLIYFS